MVRGETEAAVEVALNEVFSDSVAMHFNWRETYGQSHYAGVVADPRIQQAMLRWEEEEATMRADVEAYFSDLQAAR